MASAVTAAVVESLTKNTTAAKRGSRKHNSSRYLRSVKQSCDHSVTSQWSSCKQLSKLVIFIFLLSYPKGLVDIFVSQRYLCYAYFFNQHFFNWISRQIAVLLSKPWVTVIPVQCCCSSRAECPEFLRKRVRCGRSQGQQLDTMWSVWTVTRDSEHTAHKHFPTQQQY